MMATLEWIAFLLCSSIGILGALGMTTTMSMFRSGILLMASFIGVSGLFVLLQADLLALLQVMMYIGGMLVMILYMVLFSHDPGGAMMADMDMPLVEKFFTLGIKPSGHHHGGGSMDMSMDTSIKTPAAWLGSGVGAFLIALLVWRPVWTVTTAGPDPESARRVGQLLMNKYMMGFEGAGILILIGIFGAVWLGRPTSFPDSPARESQVAVDKTPPELESDLLEPETGDRSDLGRLRVDETHTGPMTREGAP